MLQLIIIIRKIITRQNKKLLQHKCRLSLLLIAVSCTLNTVPWDYVTTGYSCTAELLKNHNHFTHMTSFYKHVWHIGVTARICVNTNFKFCWSYLQLSYNNYYTIIIHALHCIINYYDFVSVYKACNVDMHIFAGQKKILHSKSLFKFH